MMYDSQLENFLFVKKETYILVDDSNIARIMNILLYLLSMLFIPEYF